jgi:hypothetical protein
MVLGRFNGSMGCVLLAYDDDIEWSTVCVTVTWAWNAVHYFDVSAASSKLPRIISYQTAIFLIQFFFLAS